MMGLSCVVRTNLGWIGVRWANGADGPVVQRIVFGHPDQDSARASLNRGPSGGSRAAEPLRVGDLPGSCQALLDRLEDYAEGGEVGFDDVRLEVERLTPFQRRVTQACRRIGWGETCSYGDLAAAAGRPGAARAVGNVMAANRFPLVVPCHRVLPANGKLGGFSAPGGVDTKRWLLQHEQAWRATAAVAPLLPPRAAAIH